MGIEQQFKPVLDELLIERVVGTKNHEFVKMVIYITKQNYNESLFILI